jgi:archaellum component FlaC
VEQVENKISGTKDKIEELDQTVKDHKRILRKYEWTMQDTWNTMRKPNLCILGIIKTLIKQNKERILKTAKEKDKSNIKANPLEQQHKH